MTVYDFLKQLGGRAQVARSLDVPYTTVVSWCERNKVPAWRMPKLAELAFNSGVSIPVELMDRAA